MSKPAVIPFQRVLEEIKDVDTPLDPRYLYHLSDLESSELEKLQAIWDGLPVWRKQAVMEDIEELNRDDTVLDFVVFGRFALQDRDPMVRIFAVRTLKDYEESNLIQDFLVLLQKDEDSGVRKEVAEALGRFVYAGELDLISSSQIQKLEDTLLEIINSDEIFDVRRAALESMGYSSRDEVDSLINKAFLSDDRKWKASALIAMGHSANIDWQPQVISMLESNFPLLRCSSARAAGELELEECIPYLIGLLDDPDDNTRNASIWALSQIGGEGIREILERIHEEAEDDQTCGLIESALENLSFMEDAQLMPIFDVPDDLDEDLDEYDFDEVPGSYKDDEDMEY